MKDNQTKLTANSCEEFAAKAGYASYMEMTETLEQSRRLDVKDADPEELAELANIHIDDSLGVEERIASLLKQTKNPYCFRYNGMIVKVNFAGKRSIEDCLTSCFFND